MKKIHFLFSFLMIVIWASPVFSQISQGGTPRSFSIQLDSKQAAQVPVIQMIDVDVDSLRAEDAINDPLKDRPWRFGENLFVDIDVKSDGHVTLMPNGDKIYRVSIYSPEAVSLNLTFDRYRLPAGADLFIYNGDQSEVLGAFNEQNNQDDGIFASALVTGDLITIEYFEPASVAFPGELHLFRVTHGYRGIKDFTKAFGQSGYCNVNVACPEGVGWENEINAVCMLVSGGSGFCTGSLVNNTANDGTPYILTADHCYSDPTSWVFYFNWQSATCTNPGSSPSYDQISGAQLRARNTPSDFCLVEMNSTPPSSYGVYYAGWNRATDATISGTSYGIHHPSGDIKKISWTTIPLTTTSYGQTTSPGDGSHFRVTSWADGTTTEGGSSGSALFDSNHRIVGQLHGGSAACGNTLSDWYGRFSVSWTGGGSNTTRLSNWLDPMGTAPTTLDGYDPNTPAFALDAQVSAIQQPTGTTCGSISITPTVTLRNAGSTTMTSATVYYRIDGGTPVSQTWSGSLATNSATTITFPATTSTYGTHIIESWSASPNGGTDANTANDTATASFELSSGIYSVPFVELFNDGVPPTCWTSYAGTNGLGTVETWGTTTDYQYEGTGAAIIYYENVTGGLAEDWLVTPQIQLQNNSTLTFYHRQGYTDNYNSTYSVKVSTTSQTSHASFANVQTWDETGLTTAYTKKTIDLSAYDGQNVYIAFVFSNDNGDAWLIDSLKVTGTCTTPVAAFAASSTSTCTNSAITLNDGSTGTPTSWAWSISPATFNFVGGTNATSQNPQVEFTVAGTYNIQLTATNACGSDAENKTNYVTVIAPPAQPSAIAGNANPCAGVTGLTYSVTNVGGVTYNWSVPTGWTITGGAGTNAITVTAGTAAGTISVTPSNGCDGTPQTLAVTANTVPAQPSAITGQIGPCQTTTEYYSVTNVPGVTYTWTTPADWTIDAGQGTNSITVTCGASSGSVQVTPSNTCGNGTPQTITVTSSVLPSQPSAIAGDNTPCQTSQTYSVSNVAGVTYAWSFPAGWSVTAGQGTNSVTVTPSATAGTITVTPSTGCGNGTAQTLSATPEPAVAQPSAITGAASPCAGTSQTYSVTNEAGVTYTWSFPAGWSITAGQNTNSVTVTASATAGTVTVTPSTACGNGTPQTMSLTPSAVPAQPVITGPPTPCQGTSAVYAVTGVAGESYNWTVPGDWAITAGQGGAAITVNVGAITGPIAVTPTNICGTGSAGSMTAIVETTPTQPSAITGNINPCIGSSQVYSVSNVAGVTYTWSLPTGWSQTAGGTTNSITVTTGSLSGSVSVTPSNACGSGTAQTLTVTSQAAPTVDLGPDQTICNDESTTLDAGAGFTSYSWTGGATTQTLTVDGAVLGVGNHTITVTVTNSYTCSASNDIIITVEDCSGIETATLQIGNVYPNPASESISIAFAAEYNNLVINMYDATGRLVSTQSVKNTISGNVVVVPVSQLSAGVYSLQIVSEEGIQISTVVIE